MPDEKVRSMIKVQCAIIPIGREDATCRLLLRGQEIFLSDSRTSSFSERDFRGIFPPIISLLRVGHGRIKRL